MLSSLMVAFRSLYQQALDGGAVNGETSQSAQNG
jgi:hypothetical protein